MLKKSFLILFYIAAYAASGQSSAQIIRGKISSAATQKPVSGALISIDGDNDYTAVSDSLGDYAVPVNFGNYSMAVQCKNFKSAARKNIIVLAGKQQVQDFELQEFKIELDSVIVKPAVTAENINLDLWNIQRFAAVFYDPARMVNSHAGVVNTDDQANSVSVRGTSPNYVQWKIEGVEIVNPNHLENAGTVNDRPSLNGGGVSIFSAQLLQNSEFKFAPFDPAMGNASSGIFDMKLRNGNNEKREHIIQASLLGTDISMEGPLTKKNKASYLFNYRYSTVGLLSKLGINFGDEKINYQDFSFMIIAPYKRGQLKFFGMAGSSSNIYKGKSDSTKLEIQKDLQNIDYHSFTAISGINMLTAISNTSFLRTVIAYSTKTVSRTSGSSSSLWQEDAEKDQYQQQKISTLNYISHQLNNKMLLKTGAYINYFINEVRSSVNDSISAKGRINDPLLQPFISLEGIVFKNFEIKTGLHGFYQTRISNFSLQPRLMIKYIMTDKQNISFNYGASAQLQSFYLYVSNEANRNLKPTSSQSFSIIHQFKFKKGSIKNELYYQLFDHIPNQQLNGFSAFNYFNEQVYGTLQNNGKAKVYGYDLTIERDFKSFYLIASSSIYNSIYSNGAGYFKSRFNTVYNCALTAGKEYELKKPNKFLSVDIRGVIRNGFKEVLNPQTKISYTYSEQLPVYYRIDLRISYRKNKKASTVIWALDIQNVTNHQNISYHYYDTFKQTIETKYQLGLIPVLSYKVLF